jgi:hypothetical protein
MTLQRERPVVPHARLNGLAPGSPRAHRRLGSSASWPMLGALGAGLSDSLGKGQAGVWLGLLLVGSSGP